LEELDKYKSELRSKINALKEQVCIQLDNLFESKLEYVISLENEVSENMAQYKEKQELSRRTEVLNFDLETSVD